MKLPISGVNGDSRGTDVNVDSVVFCSIWLENELLAESASAETGYFDIEI